MKKIIDINNPENDQFLDIMKELMETSELKKIMPAISMFGSARTKHKDKYYLMAEDVAYDLSNLGFSIISGGGPGIMEAINKIQQFPIILVGKEFWSDSLAWIKSEILGNKLVGDEDLDLIQLVDNKEDIKQCIEDFYTSEGNNYCLIEHKNLL